MMTDRRWRIYLPIFKVFLLKPACVAYPFFHFSVLIFSRSNAEHIFSFKPQANLTAAFIAITVCIDWFSEPHPILKTERSVRKGAHRTNIDHVAAHFIVDSMLY